ncbi:MAG: bifunctional oligoribonuclease/PAP phosphatase NrnA [Kiritimatiellae bacterium]|nr:bifunctional oligoribonuclease/PAP phosphatase NrnA [Kiritimatiellia bacterium]
MRNDTIKSVLEALRGARLVMITGHVRPDGDALGCVIALAHQLNRNGISAVGVTADRNGFGGPGFLEGIEELKTPEECEGMDFDLAVAVDCASSDRIPNRVRELFDACPRKICIDHHATNTRFADLNHVEGNASSTGEIIWKLFRSARWSLDRIAAEALWVAVVTDTGRFAYESTAPSTLRCGADLISCGVRTAYINDRLYCAFPLPAIELKRRAYQTLDFTADGAIATITLEAADFKETGGHKADVEDVVDIPRSVAGNRVAIFFYGAVGKPETRISIRTRAPYNASDLAARFGGGGHNRAAGCTIAAGMAEAKNLFLKGLQQWLKEYQ